MRSVNIIPDKKDNTYRLVLRLMLLDNVPFKLNREIKTFGKEIRDYINNHPNKILSPDMLESRHYGPLPMLDIHEMSIPFWKNKKHKDLHKFFGDFVQSTGRHAELMLHLIKYVKALLKADEKINYPGVNKKYFDSRRIEFDSISEFDYGKYPEVIMCNWRDID